jgi:hypothetical protein
MGRARLVSYFGRHDTKHPRWSNLLPGLIFRTWLRGDPEWTTPRHATPQPPMIER